MESKEITTVTRSEAIDRIIDYLNSSEKPNVIPDTTNMAFGLAGFVCIDTKTSAPKDVVYFPIADDLQITALPIADRVDMVGFFDQYGKRAFLDINKQMSTCYLVNIDSHVCATIPFALVDMFASIQRLIESRRSYNNTFFEDFLKELSERKVGTPNPTVPKTTLPKKDLLEINTNEFTDGIILDRTDFVTFFDNHFSDKFVCADVPSGFGEKALLDLNKKISYRISNSMVAESFTVDTLISSLASNYSVPQNN